MGLLPYGRLDGWRHVGVVPLEITTASVLAFIRRGMKESATYIDQCFAQNQTNRHFGTDDEVPSPSEWYLDARLLVRELPGVGRLPDAPRDSLDPAQYATLLDELTDIISARAVTAEKPHAVEKPHARIAEVGRRDGPFGERYLQWKGKRNNLTSGIVYRLVAYMWDRDNVEHQDLEGTVFDAEFAPKTLRARLAEANDILGKVGVPRSLHSKNGSLVCWEEHLPAMCS